MTKKPYVPLHRRRSKAKTAETPKRPEKVYGPNPLLVEAKWLRAKKRFAQHFLIDKDVINGIVKVTDPQPEDTLLEIGPGSGCLTEQLFPRCKHLTCVELERNMVAHLQKKYSTLNPEAPLEERYALPHNLTLIVEDILRFDTSTITAPSFKVVGNLPYNISTPILFKLIGELDEPDYPLRQRIEQATLMVQKEVGERITAKPGTKAYNALSISAQFWFHTRLDFLVPAKAFYPAPKVISAVITLTPREKPLCHIDDFKLFKQVIRTAFHQRRKTLRNSLGSLIPPDILKEVLSEVETTRPEQAIATLRAEALSIETYGAITNIYSQYRKAHPQHDLQGSNDAKSN